VHWGRGGGCLGQNPSFWFYFDKETIWENIWRTLDFGRFAQNNLSLKINFLYCAHFLNFLRENVSFSKNVHENMRKTGKNACGRMKNRHVFAKFNYLCEKTEKVG
jgi:hypothetical protein